MVQRGATPHDKQKLATISKKVASSVTEIVHAAEAIKGLELPMNHHFKSMQKYFQCALRCFNEIHLK